MLACPAPTTSPVRISRFGTESTRVPSRQHQVPVVLVRVGAGRLRPDDHVPDPHRVRVLALQRALVGHPAPAVRLGSDRRTAGAPGAAPHQRSTAPAARHPRPAPRTAPTAPAAPRSRPATPPYASSRASLPQPRMMMRQMHRVIRPVLQRHHAERRPVPHHELHIVRVRRRPRIIKHHHSPRVRLPARPACAQTPPPAASSPRTETTVGRDAVRIRRNADDGCLAERGKRPGTHPIAGHEGGAEPRITVLRKLNGDLAGRHRPRPVPCQSQARRPHAAPAAAAAA